MHLRCSSSCLALLLLAACGGRVDGAGDPAGPTSTVSEQKLDPAGPGDGPWGLWQLLSLEGADGQRQYDPPFIEIDLHPDGTAFRWGCSAAPSGSGLPCPGALRQGCAAGTIQLEGLVWRVQLADEGGDVEDEPSGDIRVGAAHYRRVAAATTFGCIP
jgi:hypothetical protein